MKFPKSNYKEFGSDNKLSALASSIFNVTVLHLSRTMNIWDEGTPEVSQVSQKVGRGVCQVF
jgi:hypothetical protein